MQNERKELTIILVGYILLLLVDGLTRNYMISKIIPESYQAISNVINGFSLFFTTIWMILIVMLSMSFTFIYVALFNDSFGYHNLIKAWINLLAADITFGLVKFSLLWIFLQDELSNLVVDNSILLKLSKLTYTVICSYLDLATIYISILIFSISLYVSNKKLIE